MASTFYFDHDLHPADDKNGGIPDETQASISIGLMESSFHQTIRAYLQLRDTSGKTVNYPLDKDTLNALASGADSLGRAMGYWK